MNTIQDLKGVRLMLLIGVVLSVIVIGGYFGFKQLQKGTTLTNLVQDGLTQNSTFHAEVSAAPTILDKVKDKDIDAKKLDNSSLLYVFNETYENLEFSKKVKDETLANHFTDGKRKLVLFTSHPTTVANYSGVIELNSDGSAKLDNKVFSPRELKFQNTRLKGEYVSGIGFGLFNSEEAERLQKSTFPHAIKVKVKENKYLLVTEGIGEGTYGKTANVSLVDADAIPDDPNNQGAISAIIPGLTDADNKTWTIDERVGEIIYQSDGTVKINSHFTTPNATVKGVLNVRVVSQDKIEATVDHYGEVKCHDPVNFTLHNQDCVALPRDQTPAGKDDKIKELEKQVKEKEKENKENEKVVEKYKEFKKTHILSFGCVTTLILENKGASYSGDMNGLAEFAESDDCGYYKSIKGSLNGRNTRQKMIFSFYKPESTKYIKDIDECRSSGEEFVCFFKGNNPMKVKQLYFKYGSWTYKKASNARKKFACYRCDDYVCGDAGQGRPIDDGSGWERLFNSSYHMYKGIFGFFQLDPNNQSYRGENTIQTTKDLMSYFHPLSFAIEDYLNSLSNENLTGNIEEFNKNKNFSFIGLMYGEDKQVRKDFVGNTYIKEIGWYGSGPQDGKILDEENQKVWNKGIPQNVQCLIGTGNNIEANPERKNYGLFYKINGKSRVKLSRDAEKFKIAQNQYDIADTLLF